MDFKHKLCVISGGSSGIGLSLAQGLAAQQARLILLARNERALAQAAATLRELGAADVTCLAADVANADTLSRLPEVISAYGEAADLVINCAGIVSAGRLDEVPALEWQRLLNTNVLGTANVLRVTLPAMRARRRGHVVNMASAAGLSAFPGMAAYCASKAAVVAMSDALRAELAASQIAVTTVCPGFVQTPIAHKIEIFGSMNNPRTQQRIQRWFEGNKLAPETVARATLKAVAKQQALVLVGRDAQLGYWTGRLAPAVLRYFTARAARGNPQPKESQT